MALEPIAKISQRLGLPNRETLFQEACQHWRSEYRKELEDSIAEKDLGTQIRIIDHCNDMPAAYMLATVVVSASTDPEGFGRIPAEAQAMGRPIIATDHGGARETIARGETGWLIPPSDAQALANAIEEALSLDPMQRAMLATRTMAHIAAHFTREIMVDKTLCAYAELLHGRSFIPKQSAAFPNNIRSGTSPTLPPDETTLKAAE